MKKKIIKLAVAAFLINSLLNSDVVGDYSGENIFSTAFAIPKHLGIIEKSESVSKLPKVIIIKDGHYIYQVQKNIAEILNILITDYGISLVGIEGAYGAIDIAGFRVDDEHTFKDEITEKYVKKGILTSIKLLPISKNNGMRFTLWGVEDAELYKKNIKARKEATENIKIKKEIQRLAKLKKAERRLEILKKLLCLDVTRKEWEYYQNNKKYFDIPVARDTDHYYKLVLKRDKVLINNLLKKMNKEKKDTAILICGGFHVKGIEDELKSKGISYIVISPNTSEGL